MAAKGRYIHILTVSTIAFVAGQFLTFPSIRLTNGAKKALGYPSDTMLNFTGLAGNFGYTSDEHTVVTEDGYILKLFRMMQGKRCVGPKRHPPVILMHGLLQSADVWLDAGPKAGLAYLLADDCHDLWVGNIRGNYYSRAHKTLNPDTDADFWNFSVDEIGLYDVPAVVDYVLDRTGAKKVNYIGFSQGSGTFYIMCSERPEYCDKVNLLVSIAPAARQTYTASRIYRYSVIALNWFFNVLARVGMNEMFAKGSLSQESLWILCQSPIMTETLCGLFISSFDSSHPGSVTKDTLQLLYNHFPAGTSLKNLVKYGQSMQSDKFEKFDYGDKRNMVVYGDVQPPSYNLSAVTVPVLIIYGRNDHLVDPKDVSWLANRLPVVKEVVEVTDPLWNHFDVTYSRDTKRLIYGKVNEYLLKYSKEVCSGEACAEV